MQLKNKQIVIETVNICNAHCIICPREKFTQKPQAMDMGLFKKIIDDAAQYELESIDTCGFGDCFLDNKFFERLAYAKEKIPTADIFVSTTGYNMDNYKWKDVAKYVDILKLSIYGATEETYEAVHRGKVKYNRSMANILGFLNTTENKPYTIGLYVVNEINAHEKDEWIQIWQPRLDEVFVWKPHNWIENRNYRIVDKTKQQSCGRPDNGPMYIHADGTVSPCCWDIHKQIKLGDLNKQTIEQVYKGEPYEDLRWAHRNNKFDLYPCQHCDQTNHNPEVLIYKSNQDRQVGQITSNRKCMK